MFGKGDSMPRCRNCGRETARTEDWACQWCGYPLLSKAFKKIPKTYRQLKEDKSRATDEPEPELRSKPEPAPQPQHAVQPRQEPQPELRSKPEPAPEPQHAVQPHQEPQPEPLPPALEITVDELLSAYEADGAGADAKFANKVLKITGLVNRIQARETFGTHYITLTGVKKKLLLQEVRCFFDQKFAPELNLLTPGQTVTVQGKYDGSLVNIRLGDCILAH